MRLNINALGVLRAYLHIFDYDEPYVDGGKAMSYLEEHFPGEELHFKEVMDLMECSKEKQDPELCEMCLLLYRDGLRGNTLLHQLLHKACERRAKLIAASNNRYIYMKLLRQMHEEIMTHRQAAL